MKCTFTKIVCILLIEQIKGPLVCGPFDIWMIYNQS